MNYTVNPNALSKIINLTVTVGKWSKCKNNIETRNISIYDRNNNTYSFDMEKLNKDGIFITERAIKCREKFIWKADNYAILISIILFIVCILIKWCINSELCKCDRKVRKTVTKRSNNIEISVQHNTKMPIRSAVSDSSNIASL